MTSLKSPAQPPQCIRACGTPGPAAVWPSVEPIVIDAVAAAYYRPYEYAALPYGYYRVDAGAAEGESNGQPESFAL